MANPAKNDKSLRSLLLRDGLIKPAPAFLRDLSSSREKAIASRKAEFNKVPKQVQHA